jgi:putative membrane protein
MQWEENEELLIAGKTCLKILKESPQYSFKIGVANTNEIKNHILFGEDIGKGGLSIILIDVNKNDDNHNNKNSQYVIGWADSNNMKSGLREYIIKFLEQKGIRMLEICSSDTHEKSGFRTSEGYYPFGYITKFETIADHYQKLIDLAYNKLDVYGYEVFHIVSTVKVMGTNQFQDYSISLDKAINLTKKFLIITFGVISLMLIVTN